MTLTRAGWGVLFATTLVIVAAWPPAEGRSLIVKTLNWVVDPADTLPVLPPQLGYGLSDDVHAVEMRDAIVRRYDELYNSSALTRTRLEWKVARDPFDPVTERQLLLIVGVVVGFLVFRR
jgi:hypothetical protein